MGLASRSVDKNSNSNRSSLPYRLRKRVDVAHPAISIEIASRLYDEERRDPTLEHYDQILQKYKQLPSLN